MDNNIGSPSLWAEHGPLGLVTFALFILIFFFVRSMNAKDKRNEHTIKAIVKSSKEERAAERQERKEVAAMHVKSFDKFSGAIDNLTDELKKGKDKSYSIGVDLVGSEKGLR